MGSNLPTAVVNGEDHCLAGTAIRTTIANQTKVVLDDLDFNVYGTPDANLTEELAKVFFSEPVDRAFFTERLCIVSDSVMGLIMEMGTELRTRIAIDSRSKTVKDGALWQEEALPVETLLAASVYASASYSNTVSLTAEQVLAHLRSIVTAHSSIQFGGNASVGQGFCLIHLR